MTASLARLALALALSQPAGTHAPPEQGSGHAGSAAITVEPEAAEPGAAGHGAPAGSAEPGEHAAAGDHGGAAGHGGEHEQNLGAVMMHHVADGYVIEHPGYCDGAFAWNCELDLRAAFGTAVDPHSGKVSGPLVLGPVDMTPTKHVVMMWIAAALLLLVVLLATRRRSLVPRGLYNFVEVLVQFVRNEIAVKNIGEKDADRFVPYLVTVFFFILFLNMFGLVPFAATATANLSVTVALALFTFFITQWTAIRAMGLARFLGHFTGGVPRSLWFLWVVMVPVEILGLFTKPFALTVRLFANMVAGHFVILALLGLIFALNTPVVALASVPMALAIFLLEIFVALVQAYIFTMLSSLFIGAGLVHHGDHDGHGEPEQHASHVAGNAPGHG
jgi:F-type H+-transporting ATPase subunit a